MKHILSHYERFLPQDAIYLVRTTNLEQLANLIQSVIAARPSFTLAEIMKKSVIPNKEQLMAAYPFIHEAFRQIEFDYANR